MICYRIVFRYDTALHQHPPRHSHSRLRYKVALAQIYSAKKAGAVVGVEVLIADNLEASRISLLCNIYRPREKYFPAAEPPLVICIENSLLVALPVVVPLLDGERIMYANVFDAVDFESCALQTLNDKTE